MFLDFVARRRCNGYDGKSVIRSDLVVSFVIKAGERKEIDSRSIN